MHFVLTLVVICHDVCEVKVEGTLFTRDDDAWSRSLSFHEKLRFGAGFDVNQAKGITIPGYHKRQLVDVKLRHLHWVIQIVQFFVQLPDDFHLLDDEIIEHVDVLSKFKYVWHTIIFAKERVVLEGLVLELSIIE